jgi:hypothetical protein
MVLLASFGAGAAQPLKAPPNVQDKIQLPIVTVVEVARSVDKRAAAVFREYIGRERPAWGSAFQCFKLVPAKSMREAKEIATRKGARFILRVQLLRRVVGSRTRDAKTLKRVDLYNTDARLELWLPSSSRAVPKGSWKMKSRCMARNYSARSPGLALMDGGITDDTDKPDMPVDFAVIGDRIFKYLQRSAFEVKKVTIERAPGGEASARVELVNHADIPVQYFTLDLGRGLCDVNYARIMAERGPIPPGDGCVAVPLRAFVSDFRPEKIPPNGPCKWKLGSVLFGFVESPALKAGAAAPRHRGKR